VGWAGVSDCHPERGGAGGNGELLLNDRQERHDLVHRLAGQIDPHLRLIGRHPSEVRVIVNLQDDARGFGKRHGNPVGQEVRAGTGSPAAQCAKAEDVFDAGTAEAGITRPGVFRRRLAAVVDEGDRVVNGLPVAGLDVDGRYVEIRAGGRGCRRHGQRVAAIHVFCGRGRVGRWIRDDQVGLSERPSAVEVQRRRQIARIALRRAVVDPLRDRVDLVLGQDARIGKDCATFHRLPGRHLPRLDHVLDVVCLRRRIGARHQRERPDVARVMTGVAVLLKNARDFVAERRAGWPRGRTRGARARGAHGDGGRQSQNKREGTLARHGCPADHSNAGRPLHPL
jgi:hypothetical protein